MSFAPSLRDYFVAHAPTETAAWFKPHPSEPCPELPKVESIEDATVRDEVEGAIYRAAPTETDAAAEWVARYWAVSKARIEWTHRFTDDRVKQWPGAWADEQIKQRPADDRAYLFAITVADADGVHAYVVAKASESATEARALAIEAAKADRGEFGVDALECELVQRVSIDDADIFIRMGALAT